MLPIVVIVGGLAVIAAAVVGSIAAGKRRTEAVKLTAQQMGLDFFPKGDPAVLSVLQRFRLFSQGRARKATNMLCGQANDVEMALLDYRYTIGHGKHSSTHRQTVISLRSPRLDLPDFTLAPEHFFHKIGSVFGYQDIDFPHRPAFSKQFLLRGENENAVRRLFDRRDVLSFFEGRKGLCAEGSGDCLILYRRRRRIKPQEVSGLMQEGLEGLELLRDSQARGV